MKLAYLILAYKLPQQLERLVNTLQFRDTTVFIHLDKKSDFNDFKHIADLPRVYFIKNRLPVHWGGFSITRAIISSLNEVTQHDQFDHIILMSGQDYPIRPLSELHEYLEAHAGFGFIYTELNDGTSAWWRHATERYRHFYLYDYPVYGFKFLQKVGKKLLPHRRFIFPEFKLYGSAGGTFCILSHDMARYLVTFTENNRKASLYGRFTYASDEFWFQTILMNSPLKTKIINELLWHIDWPWKASHPKILVAEDYEAMRTSGKFFARKFDSTIDQVILDKLDNNIILKTTT